MILIDISFVILYLLVPIFSIALMKSIGLSITRISLPSMVIIFLLIYSYIGILPLYFGWDDYRNNIGMQDKGIVLNVFLFSTISILGVILGYILGNSVLGTLRPYQTDFIVKRMNTMGKIAIGLILIICLLVLWVYIQKIPKLAILVAIMEGVSESKSARSAMGNDFVGKYHWYHLFMHILLNITTFTLFAAYIKQRKNIYIKGLFILSFIGSIFSAVMATEKGPVIMLLLGFLFVYIIVKREGRIPIKYLMFFGFLFIAILIFVYFIFMGSENISSALTSIFSRIFTGQIAPAYFYLEFFPAHHGFLWGSSFPNPGRLLPYTPYRLTVEIMNWKFPDLVSKGIVGSAPTVFWGEMYANFGVIGVLMPPIFLGIYIYCISYLLEHFPKNPFITGLIVWLIQHYATLAGTGLSTFIMDTNLIMVLLIYGIIIFIAGNGNITLLKRIH